MHILSKTQFQIQVAVKYIDRTSVANWATMPQQREPVPLEAALHQQVSAAPSCPGVVGLLDSFTEPESCLLVLERPVPCMDLYDFVMQKGGHLDEPMAKDFLRQVVQALQHCHTRGVVHRDLKMENILVESISHRLKLIDFGLASRLRDGFYRDQAGKTYISMSPEGHGLPNPELSLAYTLAHTESFLLRPLLLIEPLGSHQGPQPRK
ncbi:serine/threonine-protein kinase pim-3-like [Amia ocellicauda]|uniref:serine/threonine-protein kinase pim-3-like n=1 Tax=Amia ocellicauda TaxID=2972642 RepID=UPI003464419A